MISIMVSRENSIPIFLKPYLNLSFLLKLNPGSMIHPAPRFPQAGSNGLTEVYWAVHWVAFSSPEAIRKSVTKKDAKNNLTCLSKLVTIGLKFT